MNHLKNHLIIKKYLTILTILTFIFTSVGCSQQNEAAAIGIIGGADGPTAIYVADNSSEADKEVIQDEDKSVDSNTDAQKGDVAETNTTKTSTTKGTLKVHFIDVGQADSILVQQTIENITHNMLVDAGNNEDSDLVVNYLKNQGVKKLEYIIGTHPHEDHIGGLDAVISSFEIGKVLIPKATSTTKTFEDVIVAIKNKGLKITTPVVGDSYKLGEAQWTVLAPNGTEYEDVNNYSIVTRLVFAENSFMLTGDAEEISEGEILAGSTQLTKNLQSDVLKVGHHGSTSSTSDGFLQAVNPKYAIISCGVDNKYGHPHKETMEKLIKSKIEILRTDQNGTIIFTNLSIRNYLKNQSKKELV